MIMRNYITFCFSKVIAKVYAILTTLIGCHNEKDAEKAADSEAAKSEMENKLEQQTQALEQANKELETLKMFPGAIMSTRARNRYNLWVADIYMNGVMWYGDFNGRFQKWYVH